MLGLASLSNWNIRLELATNLLLASASYLLLYSLLRKTFPSGSNPRNMVLALALGIAVFSPVQWENWLWGWQIQWFLNVLGLLGAVAALARWGQDRPRMAVVLACAAATIGQYSLASGNLIWPVCIPMFVLNKSLRSKSWIWIVTGGIAIAVYLQGYVRPAYLPPLSNFYEHPRSSILFLVYYFGRPFSENPFIGLVAGAIVLVIFFASLALIWWRHRSRAEIAAPWISIGLYAFAAALLTDAGRVGFGWRAANPSRYTTISLLMVIATSALVSLAVWLHPQDEQPSRSTGFLVAVWGLPAILILGGYGVDVAAMQASRSQRIAILECVRVPRPPQDPCLHVVHPANNLVFDGSRYLRAVGWGGLPKLKR